MPTSLKSKRRTDSNVAILFALALVPVFAVIGAAIDYSRVIEARGTLALALNCAVAAVPPGASADDAYVDLVARTQGMTGTDLVSAWRIESVTRDATGGLTAIATGEVATRVARIFGIDEIAIGIKVEGRPEAAPGALAGGEPQGCHSSV